jgi:hypothetical protein
MYNNIVPPVTKTIYIQGIDGSGNLILSDGGETCAGKRDTIFWEVLSGVEIDEITALPPKEREEGYPDIYQEGPIKENPKRWRAKIKEEFDEETIKKYLDPERRIVTLYYSIQYRRSGETNPRTHDPKMSVNN